ncbi:glycosyltransferase family 4 protein [Camelimonas sp. ID_303_24]
MVRNAPVAFCAPMKPPDHPQPSGDRTMARNLLAALAAAGYAPEVASRLRSHDKTGDQATQGAIRDAALREADLLIARWRAAPVAARPRLWFTYHLYDRAPDWIGPAVAAALDIPYVVAEASLAPRRANGPWRMGHAATVAALRRASAVFVLNENDRPCLLEAPELADARMAEKCRALPPFLTRLPAPPPVAPDRQPGAGVVRLLAVAMLRRGDKLASFRILADSLSRLASQNWRLTIVGDGPARDEVAALFAPFGARVVLAGLAAPEALDAIYAAHDLLVWPAVNEAFGMALLEAQANGCPVLAGDTGGVSGVVRNDETGWLVAGKPQTTLACRFAARLGDLLGQPDRLPPAGAAGAAFVRQQRSLASAATILRDTLAPLLTERNAP